MVSIPEVAFTYHVDDPVTGSVIPEKGEGENPETSNFFVDRPSNPPIGLSSLEANNRTTQLLQDALDKKRKELKANTVVHACLTVDFAVGILVFALLFVLYFTDPNRYITELFFPVLLLPWLVLNCFTKATVKRIKSARTIERVKVVLNAFQKDLRVGGHSEVEQQRFSFDPPNSILIPVYRDREWRRLPANVVLAGDVFKLQIGDYFPCNCRLILSCDRDGNVQLDANVMLAGAVFQKIECNQIEGERIDGTFMAVTDSFIPHLETFLNAKLSTQSRLLFLNEEDLETEETPAGSARVPREASTSVWGFSDYTYFSKYGVDKIQFCGSIFISSCILTLCFIWTGGDSWRRHLEMFAFSLICLIHPAFDTFLHMADIWGNVKLQSLFHWHNEKRFKVDILPQQSSSSSSTFDSKSSADSVSSEMAASQIPLIHQLKELGKVFKRGLDSEGSLLRTLCSVTLLCFVDDMGLLLEGCATPQEIAIIKGDGQSISTNATNFHATASSITTEDQVPTEPVDHASGRALPETERENLVILDVFEDSSQYYKQYVKFNNDYERNCIPNLLPLSFAMSATQFPRYQLPHVYKLTPELIQTYMGMLANGHLSSFTHCLCAFTGSLGLKRAYIRRFKLMRFIVILDEALGRRGTMLIFFLRDPRKQIVQMLVKCRPEMLLDRSINYHNNDQNAIVAIGKLMKRKLRDLSMQWVSSGLFPFCYAYKPIHLDEFNHIMAHLPDTTVFKVQLSPKSDSKLKRIYSCLVETDPVTMCYGGVDASSWLKYVKSPSKLNDVDDEPTGPDTRARIIKGCVGGLVNSCLKNSVLLGMCATKYQYPKEVPNRIQSFHEAGIRVVYFSKHDEKKTRIVGGLLGLETSWNSMISLEKSDKLTHVNQDGRVVLPSGIENIRKHIQEVDDIPLQVSLFCDCTCANTVEMMRILRENGEKIMCVGNGLRHSNFFVFCEAHTSISVALGYHPICRFCRGKRWSGLAKAHLFEEATPEMKLSASITSLPCDLQTSKIYKVADPYFVIEMLYEVFKEARHMATNIQEAAAFFKLAAHSVAWLLLLQSCFGFFRVCQIFDLALCLLVYIPLIACCLLSNPVGEGTMQDMPSRCTREEARITLMTMCKTYPRLLTVTSLSVFFFCITLFHINKEIEMEFSNRYGYTLHVEGCDTLYMAAKTNCVAERTKAMQIAIDVTGATFLHATTFIDLAQQINSVALVVFYTVSSSSWIGKYGSFTAGFINIKWVLCSLVAVVLQLGVVYLRCWISNLAFGDIFSITPLSIIGGSASGFCVIIMAIDQIVKFYVRRRCEMDQKFLKLLFTTRLGMWSPK